MSFVPQVWYYIFFVWRNCWRNDSYFHGNEITHLQTLEVQIICNISSYIFLGKGSTIQHKHKAYSNDHGTTEPGLNTLNSGRSTSFLIPALFLHVDLFITPLSSIRRIISFTMLHLSNFSIMQGQKRNEIHLTDNTIYWFFSYIYWLLFQLPCSPANYNIYTQLQHVVNWLMVSLMINLNSLITNCCFLVEIVDCSWAN